MSEAAILFRGLPAMTAVAEPMQIAWIISATSVPGQLVVQVEAALVRPSAGRAWRMRLGGSQGLPISTVAPLPRAGASSLPPLLTRA